MSHVRVKIYAEAISQVWTRTQELWARFISIHMCNRLKLCRHRTAPQRTAPQRHGTARMQQHHTTTSRHHTTPHGTTLQRHHTATAPHRTHHGNVFQFQPRNTKSHGNWMAPMMPPGKMKAWSPALYPHRDKVGMTVRLGNYIIKI